jgi:hypothetical protein
MTRSRQECIIDMWSRLFAVLARLEIVELPTATEGCARAEQRGKNWYPDLSDVPRQGRVQLAKKEHRGLTGVLDI